jgi:hypothetical protein
MDLSIADLERLTIELPFREVPPRHLVRELPAPIDDVEDSKRLRAAVEMPIAHHAEPDSPDDQLHQCEGKRNEK